VERHNIYNLFFPDGKIEIVIWLILMRTIGLFFLLSITVFSQTKWSVNPGIKLGLAFGEKVQFIFGYELSFVMYNRGTNEDSRYGIVLDYDSIDDIKNKTESLSQSLQKIGSQMYGQTQPPKEGETPEAETEEKKE